MIRYAIIGGTGVYDVDQNVIKKKIYTDYGEVELEILEKDGLQVAFLSRHGANHEMPPHRVNYLGNMQALKKLGVEQILGICAVGSMNEAYAPSDCVLLVDFIDMTKSRVQTYFEGGDSGVAHVEMSDPYCTPLRTSLVDTAAHDAVTIKGEAVYVCTEGPRFETAAEIKMYQKFGGDVVGMTNVPEVVLAKELGMCYAAVGIITNWCTGVQAESIEGHEIEASVGMNKQKLVDLFMKVFKSENHSQMGCRCANALIRL